MGINSTENKVQHHIISRAFVPLTPFQHLAAKSTPEEDLQVISNLSPAVPPEETDANDVCDVPTGEGQVQVALLLAIDLLQAVADETSDTPQVPDNTDDITNKKTSGQVEAFQRDGSQGGFRKKTLQDPGKTGSVRGYDVLPVLQQHVCSASHLATTTGVLTNLVFQEMK